MASIYVFVVLTYIHTYPLVHLLSKQIMYGLLVHTYPLIELGLLILRITDMNQFELDDLFYSFALR